MRRTASQGEQAACARCQKSITLMGDRWLDSDGIAKCEAGHIHSASGESAMPARLYVDPLGPEGTA